MQSDFSHSLGGKRTWQEWGEDLEDFADLSVLTESSAEHTALDPVTEFEDQNVESEEEKEKSTKVVAKIKGG